VSARRAGAAKSVDDRILRSAVSLPLSSIAAAFLL